ncbi:hypothetical protein TSYNTROOL_05390 [Tepidanaerobacter syntrophicus]|uniref:DUF4349 domain-containing protein n=1 Tax=Tepidanaerobacter syntrophicus TaxID=224999 RepID=UPI0022EE6100|nr:DUF4349 domain-containing protein [Tepidanaerobacter syntrophicus]GLI50453.1 hypothetical protein TSYNTROOL_05390 [Tepidanaerobacter syntrophicus]
MAACKDFSDLIDKYVDGFASPEEKKLLEEHLKVCPNCRREVEELRQTVALTNLVGEVETPPNFSINLSEKINEISKTQRSSKKSFSGLLLNFYQSHKREFTAAAGIIVIFTLIFTFYNLGKNSNMNYASKESPQAAAENTTGTKPEARSLKADESLKSFAAIAESDTAMQKRLTKSITISINTEELSGKIEQIANLAEEAGGYIENSKIEMKGTNKTPERASIDARIPEAEVDKIMETFKTEKNILSWNVETKDISKDYDNTLEKLDYLRQYEQELTLILQKATGTSEIIEIQKELYNTRSKIIDLENQLALWDEDIELPHVNITIIKSEKP